MVENTRWEKDWCGLWELIEGETRIACLIPNEEFAGAIVTDIYGPYPELGHCERRLSISQGRHGIHRKLVGLSAVVSRAGLDSENSGWRIPSERRRRAAFSGGECSAPEHVSKVIIFLTENDLLQAILLP